MTRQELPWVLRGQPWTVRGRHSLFPGMYDDVVVSSGAVLAIPAAVMSIEKRSFVSRVARLVPKEHHVTFKMNSETLTGICVSALADAIIEVWRSEKKADQIHHALAGKCVHTLIRTATEKAPGAIQAFFGPDLFKPVIP